MLQKMSIQTKAWLLIAAVSIAVALICGNGIISLNRIEVIDRHEKILGKINDHILECRRQEKNYQIRGLALHGSDTINAVKKWEQLISKVFVLLNDARTSFDHKYNTEMESIGIELYAYKKVFQSMVEKLKDDTRAWDASMDKELVIRARQAQALILEIRILEETQKFSIIRQAKILTYGLGCLVVFILGVFGYFLMAKLVKPVVDLAHMLKEIVSKKGNLTLRLAVNSQDEIGDLAESFNAFAGAIQIIIKDASTRIQTLAGSSRLLDEISMGLKIHSEKLSKKANSMASTGVQMSSNTDFIATASKDTTAGIERMVQATGDMKASISEIAKNSETARLISSQAVTKARSASTRIMELGGSARNIGKVTETITEISEQTNLLALNATIEAARAGTAGLGFAVVANEIKTLARQTAEASRDIKESIQGVQKTVTSTSGEIQQVSDIIHDIDSIISSIASSVEEQKGVTREVVDDLQGVSDKIHGVSESLSQSADAVRDISREIDEVDGSAKDIYINASRVSSSSQEIATLGKELKELMELLRT